MEWKDVVGYEGIYAVSSNGDVKRVKTGRILKSANNTHGYRYVNLCKNGVVKNTKVHRIVAQAFLGLASDELVVNHINSNRSDNRIDNLEYVTRKENIHHSLLSGRFSVLDDDKVKRVIELSSQKTPYLTNEQIGELVGLSKQQVSEIVNNRTVYQQLKNLKCNRELRGKLLTSDIEQIRLFIQSGMVQRDIARKFNVHEVTISAIKHEKYDSKKDPKRKKK